MRLQRSCRKQASISLIDLWLSKAVDQYPTRIEDLIAESLVRSLKGNVFFLKNLAVPKQSFRAERRARYLSQVLVKYRRQILFVGRKPNEIPLHQSAALGNPYLIGDDGPCGGDDLSGG